MEIKSVIQLNMCGEMCPECGSDEKCLYADSMKQVVNQAGQQIGGQRYGSEGISRAATSAEMKHLLGKCIRQNELKRAIGM